MRSRDPANRPPKADDRSARRQQAATTGPDVAKLQPGPGPADTAERRQRDRATEGSAGSKAIAARSSPGTCCRVAVGLANSAAPSGPPQVGMEVHVSCSLWPFSPLAAVLVLFLEVDICRVLCR